MATSLDKRAAHVIQRQRTQLKNIGQRSKQLAAEMTLGGTVLAGAAAAAAVNEQFAGNDGIAMIGPVPTVPVLAGSGILGAAFMGDSLLRYGVLGLALGLASGAVYEYTRDELDLKKSETPPSTR